MDGAAKTLWLPLFWHKRSPTTADAQSRFPHCDLKAAALVVALLRFAGEPIRASACQRWRGLDATLAPTE
jgi:hypothetical protein